MQLIFLFKNMDLELDIGIYLGNINTETKIAINLLGGTKKVSMLLNEKPSKIKEWGANRKPISLIDAFKLFQLLKPNEEKRLIEAINNKSHLLSCKYSPIKINFPKNISINLAYIIGLILGDGYVAKKGTRKKRSWHIGVYFDNIKHQKIYDRIINKEFWITPKHGQNKPNCFESYVNSKAFHWFITKYFKMPQGKKSNRIFLTELILSSQKTTCAAIQGLFDSDGSITKQGTIQYATTSEKIAQQVLEELTKLGINASLSTWIKDKKYLTLYSVRIRKKENIIFAKKIGFRHPLKKVLLEKFTNSPFV